MKHPIDKARRHELKMLRYRKRLKKWNFKPDQNVPANLYALRSHGAPCSCYMCSPEKYSRKLKHKNVAAEM